MPEIMERSRYIPFRKKDIVEMILDNKGFKNAGEAEKFRKVCRMKGFNTSG